MAVAAFVAFIGFILYNLVQRTSYQMDDSQTAILTLFAVLAVLKTLDEFFPKGPLTTKTQVVTKTVVDTPAPPAELPAPATSDVPEWGTAASAVANPNAGKPDYGPYGV